MIKLTTILLFIQLSGYSQVIDTISIKPIDSSIEKSTIKLSLQGGNNTLQYGGKIQNINTIYLRPQFMYNHKSGLYGGINTTYLYQDNYKSIDNVSIIAGGDFDLSNNFSFGIDYSFSKYFSEVQVNSSIPHILSTYISWDNAILSPSFTPLLAIGNSTDITFQLDVTHIFIFKNIFSLKDKITIPIIFGSMYGTTDFYTVYNNKKQNTKYQNTTAFGLTNLYAIGGVKYTYDKISIALNTSYYLPYDLPTKKFSFTNPLLVKLTLAYTL